jgi:hypothetical protein
VVVCYVAKGSHEPLYLEKTGQTLLPTRLQTKQVGQEYLLTVVNITLDVGVTSETWYINLLSVCTQRICC